MARYRLHNARYNQELISAMKWHKGALNLRGLLVLTVFNIAMRFLPFVTEFAKRDLIHASDFSTLRMCNSASIGPTALKFGSKSFLPKY